MKHFRIYAAAVSLFVMFSITSGAQSKEKCDWHEKMMSEKIAFFTTELDLTPEESAVFWPVYNKISKQKMDAQKAMMTAYFALMKAVNEGNASEKEIDRLLNEYLKAKQANKDSDKGEADEYRKVLPGTKVAKLYVAEEKFRRHHIRSMKGGHHGGKPTENK